ncbi:hypothetical protein DE146DRAFT_675627 [Phaeosphaeria sp. MPI-PUGE-AT-0046c]|nr:hypothetical protein DE146DRAFT_675627 [Phaeosphaeria sp. MPI-PUGE-AT-0046c]
MYLLLRRNNVLVAITFAPYLADATQRQFLLENRHDLVQRLGAEHFSQSLICKEIGEITDVRSWNERDALNSSKNEQSSVHLEDGHICKEDSCTSCTVKDAGYRRTKCRLCDRRMQNPIASDALEALRSLTSRGALVQITVSPTSNSQTLTLLFSSQDVPADQVSSHLPTTIPTFTFYIHPTTSLVYFISHCPDSAAVKARMTHTMAIPGLLVHAEDAGVKADRTMEIHELGEAVFEDNDVEGGEGKERFRSMYRREGFVGTELGYEGLERDREFADGVR